MNKYFFYGYISMKVTLEIPKSINDIPLANYQQYSLTIDATDMNNLDQESIDFLNLKAIQAFCGISLQDAHHLPKKIIDFASMRLSEMLSSKVDKVNTFKMVGTDGVEVEFGLEPNLDNMSYGAFQDAENYMNVKDWHKLLAVLYRPIVPNSKNKHGQYLIQDYKGTEQWAEVMKYAPLSVSLGLNVFFYRLGTKLSNLTLNSMAKEVKEESVLGDENSLVRDGVDMKHYLRLLTEMSKKSIEQPLYHYTNAYTSSNTSQKEQSSKIG